MIKNIKIVLICLLLLSTYVNGQTIIQKQVVGLPDSLLRLNSRIDTSNTVSDSLGVRITTNESNVTNIQDSLSAVYDSLFIHDNILKVLGLFDLAQVDSNSAYRAILDSLGVRITVNDDSSTSYNNRLLLLELFRLAQIDTNIFQRADINAAISKNLAQDDSLVNHLARIQIEEDSTAVISARSLSNLTNKLDKNVAIVGATKTKITYDADGLVTAGTDATTTDIAEGTNLYYTDTRVNTVIYNNDTLVRADKWGPPDGGAKFNGTSQYYSHIYNSDLDFEGSFTIEAYLKTPATVSSDSRILQKKSAKGYYLRIDASKFYFSVDDNVTDLLVTSGTILPNTIYHLFGVYNGTSVKLYVDSQPAGETAGTVGSIISSDALSIASSPFGGVVYFADLHNYALSQSEIDDRWNNGKPWEFREPYETRDASNVSIFNFSTNAPGRWVNASGQNITYDGGSVQYSAAYIYNNPLFSLKKIDLSITVNAIAGSFFLQHGTTTFATITSIGTYTYSFDETGGGVLRIINGLATNTIDFDVDLVVKIGNTFSALPNSVGTNGWVVNVGGVLSVANSTGSPISINREMDGRASVSTTEVVLTNTQKLNTNIESISVIEKSGSANTIYIGSSTGVYDIANGVSVSANGTRVINVNELALTTRTLYVKAGASSLTFILNYKDLTK